jgi:hypothetical protein
MYYYKFLLSYVQKSCDWLQKSVVNFFIYFVIDAHYKSNGQKLYPIFYLFIYFLFPILDQNLVT